MIRILFILFILFFSSSTVFSLGDSSAPSNSIFVPLVNFTAIVLDKNNNKIDVENISINKLTEIKGDFGKIKITISFYQILSIKVLNLVEDKISVAIKTKNNREVTLLLNEDTLLSGKVVFGQFEVYLKDLQEVTFLKQ